ncbi:cobalamin biosynthesis family protein [Photobacterium damselae]|uniref:cobalamin biosynthesis family protein n=1 Tax=Photobacterium damselae TaxID=38293 RepID=UPI0011D11CBE|nr:cobalamin biosynthesis family protein [Photobacterium damselae]KAB1516200.1 cobalamin biosynthesis family protein [Photobacterium damselae subsp. damselae]
MTSSWFDLAINNSSLLIMWGALLLHWVLPIPTAIHPLTIWQRLAVMIAEKVNHSNDSPKQQTLAGSLAWFTLWGLALIFFIALYQLVQLDSVFQLTLLWLALDWRSIDEFGQRFTQAYQQEKKPLCQHLLAPWVHRNVAPLSLLGLGKAGAETLLVGYGRNVVTVLFWYCIGGGLGALLYRLASGLARAWSPTRSQFQFFGQTASKITALLDIVPMRIFSLLLCFGNNGKQALQGLQQQGENWLSPGPGWLLIASGHKLSIALGGPALYHDKKRERPRIGGRIAPAGFHLEQLLLLLRQRLLVWLLLLSITLIIFHLGG